MQAGSLPSKRSMAYCPHSRWEPTQGGLLTLHRRCWYSKSMLHGRQTMGWLHCCPLTCLGLMIESCPHGSFTTSERYTSLSGLLTTFLHFSLTAPLPFVSLAFLLLCFQLFLAFLRAHPSLLSCFSFIMPILLTSATLLTPPLPPLVLLMM